MVLFLLFRNQFMTWKQKLWKSKFKICNNSSGSKANIRQSLTSKIIPKNTFKFLTKQQMLFSALISSKTTLLTQTQKKSTPGNQKTLKFTIKIFSTNKEKTILVKCLGDFLYKIKSYQFKPPKNSKCHIIQLNPDRLQEFS